MIKTIDIEEAKVYEVREPLFLYKDGDEYTDITGGWGISGWTSSSRTVNIGTKNQSSLYVAPASSTTVNIFGTTNGIDLTAYSRLHIDFVDVLGYSSGICISGYPTKTNFTGQTTQLYNTPVQNGSSSLDIDVSAINGICYIAFATTSSTSSGGVAKVWLE